MPPSALSVKSHEGSQSTLKSRRIDGCPNERITIFLLSQNKEQEDVIDRCEPFAYSYNKYTRSTEWKLLLLLACCNCNCMDLHFPAVPVACPKGLCGCERPTTKTRISFGPLFFDFSIKQNISSCWRTQYSTVLSSSSLLPP